jgi:prepilin-type N-terminal cleavage/methylation domain-containing protein
MLRKQSGYSLSEVMVTVAIIGIAGLILTSLYTLASDQYFAMRSRLEAEEIGTRMEFVLRGVFSQAIDVEFDSGAPMASGTNLGNNAGRIIGTASGPLTQQILYDQEADPPGDWVTLAAFLRESSTALTSGGGQARGRPRKTGLFFRRPSAAANTAGVIFLDMGGTPGGGAVLQPSWDDNYYDRITLLDITKHRHAAYNKTTSVDFRVHIRYYRQSIGTSRKTWCPALDMPVVPACATTASWGDVERRFSITLRNNVVREIGQSMAASGGDYEDRVLGGLYFFQPALPVDVK